MTCVTGGRQQSWRCRLLSTVYHRVTGLTAGNLLLMCEIQAGDASAR